MSETPTGQFIEERGPTEMRDPMIREELKRASVWLGLALAILLVAFLAQPLLLILGGLVFASMLDGGTRLLGRVLPIGRGWRLLIVTLLVFAFLGGTIALAGMEITAQAATFRDTLTMQLNVGLEWVGSFGVVPGNIMTSGRVQRQPSPQRAAPLAARTTRYNVPVEWTGVSRVRRRR